jgi:peptidoglycan/LPS O-acetylase OafA/YrhL
MDQSNNTKPFGWRLAMWSILAALFISPFIAMQFTVEIVWDWFDFVVAALLLAGVGFAIELAFRFINRPAWRRLAIAAIVSVGILIWIEGAVGLI